ncbi:MAG: GIY-YIG nuclease family protein [Alphaproteobacteria bacterium]|nr:GIY-YIG nuclease family protein [Alphaproteobacteria bacterium]
MVNVSYVYILVSKKGGTLYVGVTTDLAGRVWQHKTGELRGFTSRYGVKRLVYYEAHGSVESAITREKSLRRWRGKWKLQLIERDNPDWRNLNREIIK